MKWKSILLQLIFIEATGWLILNGFSIERQEIEIVNGVETFHTVRNPQLVARLIYFICISVIASYVNVWNLSKLSSNTNRPFIISRSVLIYFLALATLVVSNRSSLFFESPLRLPLSLLVGISLFYFTISIAYGLTRIWLQTEKQRQQLQLEKTTAEINLLRNQLQPHFLFNALNNLLSMVDQKSTPRLAQSFEQLSQLLRYVIDETRADKVRIGQEITFIKNYISLQLLRFETDEVKVDWKVEGEYQDQLVEPGLFISFVENAFKYGTEPEKKTKIELSFDLTDKQSISFHIRNSILKRPNSEGSGTGIEAVKRRLQLIYPNKHILDIQEEGDYCVTLKLETE